MDNSRHSDNGEKVPIMPKGYRTDTTNDPPLVTYRSSIRGHRCICMIIGLMVILLLLIAVGLGIGLGTYYGLKSSKQDSLPNSIYKEDLRELLIGLENTAIDNSRYVLKGYNNSAEFVIESLKESGYTDITREYFTIPVPVLNGEIGRFTAQVTFFGGHTINIEYPQDSQFRIMVYSAGCNASSDSNQCSWEVTSLIDNHRGDTGNGCNIPTDNVTGKAVLVPFEDYRGNCTLYDKAYNLKEAGAEAVIYVSDDASSAYPPGFFVLERNDDGSASYVDIPSIGITNSTGNQFLEFLNMAYDVKVTIELSVSVTTTTTYNIIADTSGGRPDRTVMIGGHLDSVPYGPGINDDGSGSMTTLLIAKQIAKLGLQPVNKVRFVWWSAEEIGLLGSRYYVASLTEQQKSNISLYLNFDMIASTNYIRAIHDGETAGDDERLVRACVHIQKIFEEYFNVNNKTWMLVPFNGRTDTEPFLDAGIPAGGIFTGEGSIKTDTEYKLFGGILNAPFDSCYHQACDTFELNINLELYELTSKAVAYTLEALMNDKDLEESLK